jgi:pSer/pThr/pTyr-binding forkhead associated (FHA) protein
MPAQAQLEIISPSGEAEFRALDPGKGVVNIGRHPDNDIVIDSPNVQPFHAVLDYRQRPFQIMVLTEEGQTRLQGQPLVPNVFERLSNWDTIEIDGYAIIILEGEEVAPQPLPVQPVRPEVPPPPSQEVPVAGPEAPAGPAVPGAYTALAAVPPDQTDDVILVEISEREWTVDVEQTAVCQLTVVNGGQIVAAFDVRVEGIDPDWVAILPPRFNLNEGARATVTISIEPPRASTSRAGVHPLAIVVTSSNYPGHVCRLGARLTINPYYEFAVGELSPKQQTITWHQRSGQVTLPITNLGNSQTTFRMEGEDDERGLRFEFDVPGEEASLVRQAEMRLATEETYTLPIAVTPVRRRLIALRSHQYPFTITASMVEGLQTPRSVMGRASARPLIGPLVILLIAILVAALLIFFFRPVSEPILSIDNAVPSHGQSVQLTYNALRFPALSRNNILNYQNSFFLRLDLEFQTANGAWQVLKSPSELTSTEGTVTDSPLQNGRYRLVADTWVSRLIPVFEGVSREVPVYVQPVEPQITQFQADRNAVFAGQTVTLFWQVVNAETLTLEHDGIEETLKETDLQSGQRSFTIEKTTTFTLVATNSSWPTPVKAPLTIQVIIPTPTPIPTPVIVRFDVQPLQITAGETVRIDWAVTGADSVSIDHVGQGLPVEGNVGAEPAALTDYRLTAYKTAPDGTTVQNSSQLMEVIVNTPPPPPEAPVVEVFEVTPNQVVGGSNEVVKLTWSISGATTNIEITAPNFKLTGLEAQGFITVTPEETTLYVLTAYNGDLNTSKPAEVTVLAPTPTSTPTPVPTAPPPPTATPTPFPPPIISYYKAQDINSPSNAVVYQSSYNSGSGVVYVYQVIAGTRVELSWGVKDADTVSLENLGSQPPEGNITLPDPVVQPALIKLTAENNGGNNQVNAFIQFKVASPPPPPPPLQVSGVEDSAAGTNTIQWGYKSQDRASIDGFRVYRANVPPGSDFVAVWTLTDPNATTWTDHVSPTCGKAYYVVAVYTDLVNNVEKETAASVTSWYSQPCP